MQNPGNPGASGLWRAAARALVPTRLPPLLRPRPRLRLQPLLLTACLLLPAACATVGELPPVDLSKPGWTTWHGQALWQPSAHSQGIAGDLIAARNQDGRVLVSFTKPPLPIFTARSTDDVWKIQFVGRGRNYSGHGTPPRRFIWFRLPAILEGAAPPRGWHIQRGRDELSLTRKGEHIRLVLDE